MMNLSGKRILLTGATGGLGYELAKQLAAKGAELALLGRNIEKLNTLKNQLHPFGCKTVTIAADLSDASVPKQVAKAAKDQLNGIDIVIHNAGIIEFVAFENQSEARIQEMIQTNVTSVIQLSNAIIPHFLEKNAGHMVFVGSIYGSLGFPHYASYCASKYAVHGFSQALRRELVDTNIGITYVAPRFIKTAMNNENATAMTAKSGNKMDTPEQVAQMIVQALEKKKQEVFIGQPEGFFAWLNNVAPTLTNIGLKKQVAFAKPYLEK